MLYQSGMKFYKGFYDDALNILNKIDDIAENEQKGFHEIVNTRDKNKFDRENAIINSEVIIYNYYLNYNIIIIFIVIVIFRCIIIVPFYIKF